MKKSVNSSHQKFTSSAEKRLQLFFSRKTEVSSMDGLVLTQFLHVFVEIFTFLQLVFLSFPAFCHFWINLLLILIFGNAKFQTTLINLARPLTQTPRIRIKDRLKSGSTFICQFSLTLSEALALALSTCYSPFTRKVMSMFANNESLQNTLFSLWQKLLTIPFSFFQKNFSKHYLRIRD